MKKKTIKIVIICISAFAIILIACFAVALLTHPPLIVHPDLRSNSSWISEDGRLLLSNDGETTSLTVYDENYENPKVYDTGSRGRVIYIFEYDESLDTQTENNKEVWSVNAAEDDYFKVDVNGKGITKEYNLTFNRIWGFDMSEYDVELERFSPAPDSGESGKTAISTPCEAVSIAIKAWSADDMYKHYDKIQPPYTVYYDKQNECWLVRSSYKSIKIFGWDAFPTDSYNAIIRKSDGEVLCYWTDAR